LDRPLSELRAATVEHGYPPDISCALVGSCTNSSYEDIGRAAHVARQAKAAGLHVKSPLLVTPGSEQVRATVDRDGLLEDLEAIGATVLANACGPCIGQWKRDDVEPGTRNTIVSSFNRNFPRRNDGSAETLSFIGSPETVVAMALSGRLDVDFVHEPIIRPGHAPIWLQSPVADELPSQGFARNESGYLAPAVGGSTTAIVIRPDSQRLERLEPFAEWDGHDLTGLCVLVKAVANARPTRSHRPDPGCATAATSPTSPRISFSERTNAFASEAGHGIDVRDGSRSHCPTSLGHTSRPESGGSPWGRELRRRLVSRARRDGTGATWAVGPSSLDPSPGSTKQT